MEDNLKLVGFILTNRPEKGRFSKTKKLTFERLTTGELLKYPSIWSPVYTKPISEEDKIKEFKLKINKETPISKGLARQFCKCNECGNLAYYDYTPYSLSRPILTAYCGHRFKESYTNI